MKQVLITGGATGIGAATAQVFLERGYRVFVTVHQAAAELPGVTAIPCDITDPADVERLFAAVGTVDVLVNNAGISLIRQIQDTTPEDYDALMGVNCKGVFLCSRAAAVNMLRRHSGAIVNVSSMWGQVGASCETVYSMSKAGVIGFTRALAQELAPEGIAVNCVAPGIIDTRMNACFDRAGGRGAYGSTGHTSGGGRGCAVSGRESVCDRPGVGGQRRYCII